MKKIIAMISAIAMCAAMFTACGSDNAETTETTASETTVAESTEATEETENDTATESAESDTTAAEGEIVTSVENAVENETEADTTAAATESAPAETLEELPVETEETTAEEDAPAEDSGEVDANPLQAVVDAGLAAGEWPAMMEVTDTMMLTDYFMLDPENANYRNMIVMQCPMSATMSEIIIIEAEDVEAAKADLNARREKAISQDAWYPNDVELAEASIVGTEGSFAYFILAGAAAEAEPAIVEALKAL